MSPDAGTDDPDEDPDQDLDRDLDQDLDQDLEVLATAYATQEENASAHPISATPVWRLREVLGEAFETAVARLGDDPTQPVLSTGRVELPDTSEVETSTTRAAEGGWGRIVLHETAVLLADGAEVRTTIALTGSSPDGDRFWLGATSYAGDPVVRLELVGDLTDVAAPVLGQVLSALRGGASS